MERYRMLLFFHIFGKAASSIYEPSVNVTVVRNETMLLQCRNISGSNDPQWIRVNQNPQDDNAFTTTYAIGRNVNPKMADRLSIVGEYTLVISKVTVLDGGLYCCIVTRANTNLHFCLDVEVKDYKKGHTTGRVTTSINYIKEQTKAGNHPITLLGETSTKGSESKMLTGFSSMPIYLIAAIIGCIIMFLGIFIYVKLQRQRLCLSAAHNHPATSSRSELVQTSSIDPNFQNMLNITADNDGAPIAIHNQLTQALTNHLESTGTEGTPGGSLFDNVEPSSSSISSEPNIAVSDSNTQLNVDLESNPHQYDACIPERYFNTLPFDIVDNNPHIYDECGPAERSSNVYESLVKEEHSIEHVYL